MSISKVTRNFQVTLPRDIRELRGIGIGDKVLFVVEDSRIDLVKVDKGIISKTGGLWAGMKETGVEYKTRLRKEWGKREVP